MSMVSITLCRITAMLSRWRMLLDMAADIPIMVPITNGLRCMKRLASMPRRWEEDVLMGKDPSSTVHGHWRIELPLVLEACSYESDRANVTGEPYWI